MIARLTFGSCTIRHTSWLRALPCLAAAVAAACAAGASAQTWQDQIGYTMLKQRLGANLPTGAGGVLSMVEAPGAGGAYYADTSSNQFNGSFDPTSTPVQFTDGSGGASAGVSSHANGVATFFFGDITSMAPAANQVVLYEANDWLGADVLHYSTSAPPEDQNFRVQNHSWIHYTTGLSSDNLSALRKFDYLIDDEEMTAVVGANNYFASAPNHPALFAHSYNAIVAGRTDSYHSRGVTGVHTGTLPGEDSPQQYGANYGAGRYRPDIVAPMLATSQSSPVVGSAAAMLHEAVAGTDASRSETMKAILLAGATKQEFASFDDPTVPGPAINAWDRTTTRPLDDVFGAGELNVYNSYLIQLGGQHAGSQSMPTATAGSYGWDYQDHQANSAAGDIYYNFEVPAGSTADELSIMLAWNVKITDTNSSPGTFTPVQALQNLDLEFYDSSGSFLGELRDESVSTQYNVEHIYLTDLDPGSYTLKVSGAAGWDFGLAWRMATKFDLVSADFDGDGLVGGRDFLIWQRNLGALLGAAHGDGDADGDGDVDSVDLVAVRNGLFNAPPAALAKAMIAAVPEPTTLALAAGALLTAAAYTRRTLRRG